MNAKRSLKTALTSILAAAVAALAVPTLSQSRTIVISGTGRNLTVSQRAPMSSAAAERRNESFTEGFNDGYAAGYRAGYRAGYNVAYNRVAGTAAVTANANVDTTGFGGNAEFQRGYRSGYRVGYDQGFTPGSAAGNQAALAASANTVNTPAGTAYGPVNSAVITDQNLLNGTATQFANPVVGGGGISTPGVNNTLAPGGTTGINAGVNNLVGSTLPNGTVLSPNVTLPNNGFNTGVPVGFQNTGFVPGNFSNNFGAIGNFAGPTFYGFNNGVNNGLFNFTTPFNNGFNNVTGFNSNFANNLANYNNLYQGSFNQNLRGFTGGLATGASTTGTTRR